MKAIILVGGLGTRLRPLTCDTPKSLVPILGTPFIEHMLKWLMKYGVHEVILTLSHLAPAIQQYLGDGQSIGMKIRYIQEPSPLGTAGAVGNAALSIDEPFLVLNGDIFTEIDISEMQALHKHKGATATIALTPVENPSAYGLVKTNAEGFVLGFTEKPEVSAVNDNFINAGIYILEPEVLSLIPPGENYSFERGVFPDLVKEKKTFFAYSSSSYWIDIGTPEKYTQLNRDILAGLVGNFGFGDGHEIVVSGDAGINYEVKFEGPVYIDHFCRLAAGTNVVGPAILGKNCHIGADTVVTSSILWERIQIGSNSRVTNSIVASDCTIGHNCHLDSVIVGERVTISDGYQGEAGAVIFPDSHL